MNQPESQPLDGVAPDLQTKYSAFTGVGRALRQGEAIRHLKLLSESAARIEAERKQLEAIKDRVTQEAARTRFEMNHVLEFGVSPFDRNEFQEVLEDVSKHGGLTLHEAAALAHARCMQNVQSVNGGAPGDASASP